MSIILRADVDKPYGNSTLLRKIVSKLEEDYLSFQLLNSKMYLSHLSSFLQFCNSENVAGIMYFRHCTLPDKKNLDLMHLGGHKLGFHAENTRSFKTFKDELNLFREKVKPYEVNSFSKHGSGVHKLGKNHYPLYEPDKYLEWSKQLNISYISGNDIATSSKELFPVDNYFSKIFWIEREYRNKNFFELEDFVNAAKTNDVVLLIHPCNFDSTEVVREDFMNLIKLAKRENVSWKVM
jgi:hypothetical protein